MKKTPLITIISIVLIIVSLIGSLWLDDSIGSRIVNVVTIITGIIGALALFVQFKKDKQINAANFLMNYGRAFYDECDLMDILGELDKVNTNPNYKFDYEKFRIKIIVYLQWLESLASLIERKVVDLYTIDNTFSYRFFLIINNKQVQDNELIPNAEFYRGCYYLYDIWHKYEEKRGLKMPLEKTALHLSKDYQKKLEEVNSKIKIK